MWSWICLACLAISVTISAETKVLAIAGSTREGSINKKLVTEAANFAKQMGASVTIVDLKDYQLPFYDADLEAKDGMPVKAKQLRALMMQSQVILIASPEYNGSLPAVLKNVIDWTSRNPEGKPSRDAYLGKKFVVMSTSPGPGGGAKGLDHIRSIIENIGGIVVAQQLVVPNGMDAFDDKGLLKDPTTRLEMNHLVQKAINDKSSVAPTAAQAQAPAPVQPLVSTPAATPVPADIE